VITRIVACTRIESSCGYTFSPMGYKYDERDILTAAVEAVLEEGLSVLTFGRLAQRIGIADRSIVYYFPTKTDLISRTVLELGVQLQGLLGEAFGDHRVTTDELLRRAWPVLTSPAADPYFAVFFEMVGLAAASAEPYDTLAPALMTLWAEWLVDRIDAPPRLRHANAYATIATLDGLLLLRHTCGPDIADLAASNLGITKAKRRVQNTVERDH
jgi:AcrR family transcriptional regulator